MHNITSRSDLIKKIANDLIDNDLINLDYSKDFDRISADIVRTIDNVLDDYVIVEGNVLL